MYWRTPSSWPPLHHSSGPEPIIWRHRRATRDAEHAAGAAPPPPARARPSPHHQRCRRLSPALTIRASVARPVVGDESNANPRRGSSKRRSIRRASSNRQPGVACIDRIGRPSSEPHSAKQSRLLSGHWRRSEHEHPLGRPAPAGDPTRHVSRQRSTDPSRGSGQRPVSRRAGRHWLNPICSSHLEAGARDTTCDCCRTSSAWPTSSGSVAANR
jgi:hypothetical protein